MFKIQTATVYPVDANIIPVIRHTELLNKISIKHLVSPVGWGLSERDAGILDGGEDTGFIIESDFQKAIMDSDILLLVNSEQKLDFDTFIFHKILMAKELNKSILLAMDLKAEDHEKLEKNNVVYTYIGLHNTNINDQQFLENENTILDIDTPVVFVTGISERTDKFEIQLAMTEQLKKMQYKVTLIASRKHSELLGAYSMPDFMTEIGLMEPQKILSFNHYVKYLEIRDKPDLIIIGIPGGILPISNKFPADFGIMLYEISHAVTPDYVILSTFCEDYTIKSFESISHVIQRKYGYPIDCFNISAKKIAWLDSVELDKLCFLTLDNNFVSNKIKGFNNYNIHNVLQNGSEVKMAQNILKQLNEYTYVKSV